MQFQGIKSLFSLSDNQIKAVISSLKLRFFLKSCIVARHVISIAGERMKKQFNNLIMILAILLGTIILAENLRADDNFRYRGSRVDRRRPHTPRNGRINDRDRARRERERLERERLERERLHRERERRVRIPYRYYRHNRPVRIDQHRQHYSHWRFYHRTLPYNAIYRNSWVRFHVNANNGYYYSNGYPYFVFNGYQHRYSDVDLCNYELVDSYTNSVERSFHNLTCDQGYDLCADLRDDYNDRNRDYRYFCSERLEYERDYHYNWNVRSGIHFGITIK